MSFSESQIKVQDIEHLGIVAGIIDGLGFISAPLYLFEKFFSGIGTEHLLGEGIQPEHLNDEPLQGKRISNSIDKGVERYHHIGINKQ